MDPDDQTSQEETGKQTDGNICENICDSDEVKQIKIKLDKLLAHRIIERKFYDHIINFGIIENNLPGVMNEAFREIYWSGVISGYTIAKDLTTLAFAEET